MPADALVGLQWGSEGKGKIAAYLSSEYNAMVRSGGPQAGHTFYHGSSKYINRQIPCGVIDPECMLFITAGGIVNLDVLVEEIRRYQLYPDRLMIDPMCMVATEHHITQEKMRRLDARISSTTEGVGAAQCDKIWRTGRVFKWYAKKDPELCFYCNDVADSLIHLSSEGSILLEGTQGYGLCLNHGSYPYCTSRDILASSLLSDAGLPPNCHRQTIGVVRTYPIRVGGNSGPAGSSREITWRDVAARSGYSELIEYTTITGKVRRVFEQDYEVLGRGIRLNGVSMLAVMFIDYINCQDRGVREFENLSDQSKSYIHSIEDRYGVFVGLIGTGPGELDIIDRRSDPPERPLLSPIDHGLSDNFMSAPWDSGEIERFIDRKMDWPRQILTWNTRLIEEKNEDRLLEAS